MKKKLLIYIFILFILTVGSVLVSAYWYLHNFSQQEIKLQQPDQLFVLKRGTSITAFVKQVEQNSLFDEAYLIPYLMKISPTLQEIKSGTYQLSSGMTVEQFLKLLVSGKEVKFSVTFVEGKSAKDWLLILSQAPDLESVLAGFSLNDIAKKLSIEGSIEGWLYPETYSYISGATDISILNRAYKKMQKALQTVWDGRAAELPYKTPYELLIMASIIEKETSVDDERAKVASVFVNRLKYRMKLQTDPSIIYGLGERYTGQILRKDLQDKSNLYNTYIISGLPPTPITMPSLASLMAAGHPETTNYLYFVADGQGGHIFTTNYQDHQKAVESYWRLMKARRASK